MKDEYMFVSIHLFFFFIKVKQQLQIEFAIYRIEHSIKFSIKKIYIDNKTY